MKARRGRVDDPLEREADRVADDVVSRGSAGAITSPSASTVQRMSEEKTEEDEKSTRLQRKAAAAGAGRPSEAQSQPAVDGIATSGVPLSRAERAYFEPRFGRDFSSVRIHAGAAANWAAQTVNARAFTLGRHIVFADGQFQPDRQWGRQLIAHELAHTIQQSGAIGNTIQRSDWGLFGGGCCNRSSGTEWAIVGEPSVWQRLESGECSGTLEDCDGMTCGGGFYSVPNFVSGSCKTPRRDSWFFRNRRWTPTSAGSSAVSPTQRGGPDDTPPGYVYDVS